MGAHCCAWGAHETPLNGAELRLDPAQREMTHVVAAVRAGRPMSSDPKLPATHIKLTASPLRPLRFALGDSDSPEAVRLTVRQGVPVAVLRPGWLRIEPWFPSLLNQLLGVDYIVEDE